MRARVLTGVAVSLLVVFGVMHVLDARKAAEEVRLAQRANVRPSFYRLVTKGEDQYERIQYWRGSENINEIVAAVQTIPEMQFAIVHVYELGDRDLGTLRQETYRKIFYFKWQQALEVELANVATWEEALAIWQRDQLPTTDEAATHQLLRFIKTPAHAAAALRIQPLYNSKELCNVIQQNVVDQVANATFEETLGLMQLNNASCKPFEQALLQHFRDLLPSALAQPMSYEQLAKLERQLSGGYGELYDPSALEEVAHQLAQKAVTVEQMASAYAVLRRDDPEREALLIRWRTAAAGLIDTARTKSEAEQAWRLCPPGSQEEQRALGKLTTLF